MFEKGTPISCIRCLYKSDHPFGLTFHDGVCSGCSYHEEKNELDWHERKIRVLKVVKPYRSKSGNYDCIVPVTGGQDSFFLMHLVVNELRLRPLMVNFNRNFNSKIGLSNLARLRSIFDCDFQQFTPNPELTRRVIRTTLRELGTLNWFWIAGQTSYPLKIAKQKGIPLIIWGAHQGNEQVGMYKHVDEVEMTKRYRREFDLLGEDENSISRYDLEASTDELQCIRYLSDNEIAAAGIRGIYLGNYFRWDPVRQHRFVIQNYGYQGKSSNRTYYKFDNPDCNFYNEVQDKLKFMKLGYSKVTDQLVRDIRHGRKRRSTAKYLQKFYESRSPNYQVEFARWLGATRDSVDLLYLINDRNFTKRVLKHDWREESEVSATKKMEEFRRRVGLRFGSTSELGDKENSSFGKGQE